MRLGSPWLLMAALLGSTLASLSGCQRETASETKIIGGRRADDHRFMAGIVFGDDDETGCGGTFIAPRVVVTAAHCAVVFNTRARVRAGANPEGGVARPLFKIEAALVHPDYDSDKMQNDVALLLLEPAAASTPQIESLPLNQNASMPADTTSEILTVIGRGNTSSFGSLFEDVLRQVDIPVIPQATCAAAYGADMITSGVICAGDYDRGGIDSCQGDSGGPLVQRINGQDVLIGIVSWGIGCAQAKKPGVYTRVSSVAAWIAAETARLTTPVVDVDGGVIASFIGPMCYQGFKKTNAIGSGERTGVVTLAYTPSGAFDEVSAEPSPATDVTEATPLSCDFMLPGDAALTAAVDLADGPSLKVAGAGRTWRASVTESISRVRLDCADSLDMTVRYSLDGSKYFAMGGSFYDVTSESQTAVAPDAFKLTCRVGSLAANLFIQATPQGALEYLAQFDGAEFGAAGKTFALEKSGDSGASIVADLAVTTVENRSTGQLKLLNNAADDIFTWELTCGFDFVLTDEFDAAYASKKVEDEDLWAVKFIAPAHLHGSFLKGTAKTFSITLPAGVEDGATCSVNDSTVALNITRR